MYLDTFNFTWPPGKINLANRKQSMGLRESLSSETSYSPPTPKEKYILTLNWDKKNNCNHNHKYYIAGSAHRRYEANLVFWLAARAGKMCASFPFGTARIDPAQENKVPWSGLTKFVNLGKYQQKAAEDSKTILVNLMCYNYSWRSFPVLEINKSFLIPITAKLFCYIINLLLTSLSGQDAWILASFFSVFLCVSVHKSATHTQKKNSANAQPSRPNKIDL